VPILLVLWYERPIRSFLNREHQGEAVTPEMVVHAKQRLLNEPFVLIAVDFAIWLVAGMVYPAALWMSGAPSNIIGQPFFMSLFTGLITTAIAFFVSEHILQRKMVPHFFPQGRLYMTPKTLRIRISTRIGALVFAANLVPFFAMVNIAGGTFFEIGSTAEAIDQLRSNIVVNAIIFMGVGVWLGFLVSTNLSRPLEGIIRVLQEVRNGRFDKFVL
jgi:hypothetical protein